MFIIHMPVYYIIMCTCMYMYSTLHKIRRYMYMYVHIHVHIHVQYVHLWYIHVLHEPYMKTGDINVRVGVNSGGSS